MTSEEFINRVLALPDAAAQQRYLSEHAPRLDGQLAEALKAQADHFLRADIDRSLQMAELLLSLAELTGDGLQRALGLLAEANVRAIGLSQYERAIELYDEASAIYVAHDRPVDQARAQIGKLYALSNLGRYREALETGQWASRELELHGEWALLARLTVNLAIVHGRQGEDAGALELFDKARDLYPRMGEAGELFLAQVEPNRAVVLRNLGRFDDAIRASQTAWEILERLDQRVAAARARQNLAITYFVLGRYNEALELLDQARDVFLSDGRQRDAMLVDLFISDCLLQLRRFTDVLAKCSQARERFTALGTRLEIAQAVLNEAVAYAGRRHYPEALSSLAEARRLFEAEGNRVWVASTDLETSAVLHHQGQFEASLRLAQACAGVFGAHDLPVMQAQAFVIAARAAATVNQPDLARRLVLDVLAVGESKDIPSLVYQAHYLLGTLARAQGDHRAALAAYDRAIQELERLRGRLMVEFRADFLEDKQVVYEDMVGLCLEMDQPLRGLDYAERAKSRALLDLLACRLDLSIRVRDAEDRRLVEELTRLRAERDRLYRRWNADEELKVRGWTSGNGGRHRVRQDVLALERQIEELWYRLLIHNADYARDAALWQVRTEPVQPYLPPETMLLEYFSVRGELIAFLVTDQTVEARRLPIDLGQVQRLIQLLWLNFRAVPRTDPPRIARLATNARGLLHELHQQLITPLAAGLEPFRELVIVPHGPLHYVPFAALHDGHRFLLECHVISYLPGASLLRYVREARPAGSGSVAVGHSFGGALPYAVQEAESIAAILGAQAVVEDEATPARLREALHDSRVLHVAAHGEFRPDNPLFSGLALSDGWLTTLDVFNLHMQAALVTLSACQTGQSVIGGGDELLGLMRAFLYAGTASLVLSRWSVEDRSTARLMERFYRRLAAGRAKGAALRDAQLQFVQGRQLRDDAAAEAYSHPYFWAPFFLVGDTGPLWPAETAA